MAITLGTNIPSYNARMSLNGTTSSLTEVMKKLSTGLKINRAGDDAAGLVISENMEALIRGSKQAQANIQTASSFLTIAEDGMVSIGEHLQRANDLLTNMANDTNDEYSRAAAVREIIERLDEINRLAESTNFNGRTMLDGSAQEIYVQMGPDETSTSVLEISRALTDCHVEALNVTLPGYLHPDAKIKYAADGSTVEGIYIPTQVKKETTDPDTGVVTFTYETQYLKEGSTTGEKIEKAEFDALTDSAFEPTNENCRKYMARIQDAIAEISTRRGYLGAYENRMQSSYDSMTTRIESLESAKTTYTDTDIAEEATNMTQKQIMQQINVSILAQANSMQSMALSLLGG